MESGVPNLKSVVLEYICKNFDTIFYKKLHKIRSYLKEQSCSDCTEYFIEHQDIPDTCSNGQIKIKAITVLQDFIKARGLGELLWKETQVKKGRRIKVGLEISNVIVELTDIVEKKQKAKNLAALLMVKKLYSKFLSDPILISYCKKELGNRRSQVYQTESVLRTAVPACAVNAVDELRGYEFTERERWETLANIPEYNLRRSHFLLLVHPNSRVLDFSFCPALFSPLFLDIVLKKTKKVRSVNLQNCGQSLSNENTVITIMKKCQKTLRYLNLNRCSAVESESVFRSLRKYDIPLKQLSIAALHKDNTLSCREFHRYFTSRYGRLLLSLDLSGLTLCETELHAILAHCKKLEQLILEETKLQVDCYCHSPECLSFDTTAITKLKVLNLNRSPCKDKVVRVLIDNNSSLESLSMASLDLSNVFDPIELRHLQRLRSLDISFFGNSAYEDFAAYKQELSPSLRWLKMSGYTGVDVSHLCVASPYLTTLILNTSVVDLSMTRAMRENMSGKTVPIPHTIEHLQHLTRLELRYTSVDLRHLFDCDTVLPLVELVLEGDMLDNDSLLYIVNRDVDAPQHRRVRMFSNLKTFHMCNCNLVTDWGIDHAEFKSLPALSDLVIERCSGIRRYNLARLQQVLKMSNVSLTCYVQAERPKFHARREVEIVMG